MTRTTSTAAKMLDGEPIAIIIVGDRFRNLATLGNVIAVSDFENLMLADAVPDDYQYRFGQGVDPRKMRQLQLIAKARGIEVQLDASSITKCGGNVVHKVRSENSMLGIPRQIEDDLYEIDILIDDRCAEMSDHVTGYHVQGMVLLEAARQSFLAVTEMFYPSGQAGQFYFVINEFNIQYRRFAFPLPLTLQYRVVERVELKRGAQSFRADINILQAGESVCSVQVAFSTYDKDHLAAREEELARRAIAAIAPAMSMREQPRIAAAS